MQSQSKRRWRKHRTKYIQTGKIKNLILLDKLMWVIPPLLFVTAIENDTNFVASVFRQGVLFGFVALIVLFLMMGIMYIPLMVIWHAVTNTLKKNEIAKTTFPVLEDFDYFRDELTGISPATISMCVDFAIERDKDLAAQLLKFTMQGLITTEGSQIVVLPAAASAQAGLPPSDQFLLSALQKGALHTSDADRWASLAQAEVLAGPYLNKKKEPQSTDNQSNLKGCLGCLPFLLSLVLTGASYLTEPVQAVWLVLDQIDQLSAGALFALLLQDQQHIIGLVIMVFTTALSYSCLAFPLVHTAVEYALFKKGDADYRRTTRGDILIEEIYGLKNFIHDFSDLEHAQKEALILWDDFLIYAVLLEENTEIVSEITAMRNVSIITPQYSS